MSKKVDEYLKSFPIAQITGKDVFVTGGNSGIGYALCSHLLECGAKVHLCARNEKRGKAAVEALKEAYPDGEIHFYLLDISSYDSLLEFSKKIQKSAINIDAFVHNAGVYRLPKSVDEHGFEITALTNAVGPLLLHDVLLPYLNSLHHPVSEIFTSSVAIWTSRFHLNDPFSCNCKSALRRYANSKVALYKIARAMQQTDTGNVSILLTHPGACSTPLISKGYSKGFAKLARGFMSLVFHGPDSASLPDLLALEAAEDSAYYRPRGFLSLSGLPKKGRYPKRFDKDDAKVLQIYEEKIKEAYQ